MAESKSKSPRGGFVKVGNEQVSNLAWKRIREDFAKELVKKSQKMTCARCKKSICENVYNIYSCNVVG